LNSAVELPHKEAHPPGEGIEEIQENLHLSTQHRNVILEVDATHQSVRSKIHESRPANIKAVRFLHSTLAAVLGTISLTIGPIEEKGLNNIESLIDPFSGYDIRLRARTSLYSLPLDLFAVSVLSMDRRD
jgi:hypothetical protein